MYCACVLSACCLRGVAMSGQIAASKSCIPSNSLLVFLFCMDWPTPTDMPIILSEASGIEVALNFQNLRDESVSKLIRMLHMFPWLTDIGVESTERPKYRPPSFDPPHYQPFGKDVW